MQRIAITGLALVATVAATCAIYLGWEVAERDSRIAALERDVAAARKSSESATGAKSSHRASDEDVARLRTGQGTSRRPAPH